MPDIVQGMYPQPLKLNFRSASLLTSFPAAFCRAGHIRKCPRPSGLLRFYNRGGLRQQPMQRVPYARFLWSTAQAMGRPTAFFISTDASCIISNQVLLSKCCTSSSTSYLKKFRGRALGKPCPFFPLQRVYFRLPLGNSYTYSRPRSFWIESRLPLTFTCVTRPGTERIKSIRPFSSHTRTWPFCSTLALYMAHFLWFGV